ncbi:hypothetical protein [Helicobacter bilis]|nr:hypothetical protein [Helicobacter bilis]
MKRKTIRQRIKREILRPFRRMIDKEWGGGETKKLLYAKLVAKPLKHV